MMTRPVGARPTAFRLFPMVLFFVIATGCETPAPAHAAGDRPAGTEIFVVSHGWHAGIVIRRADVPPGYWPELRDFPTAEFLEIGWGDRDYYQAIDPGLWLTLKAALWPSPSVLHVVGFRGPVETNFPHSEILALPVTRTGIGRLLDFIDAAHDRERGTPAAALGPGLYGDSRFYRAHGSFHLFNNCNRWTATALRRAGYDAEASMTVGGLLDSLRRRRAPDGPPQPVGR